RPSVEATLERDDPGLGGRLAGVFQRRLDRLRSRGAEERLRATEAFREQPRELFGRFRPVEVRRVPEPLELVTCGGKWRRVTVAERDDRDPASEVEVHATFVVPHAAAAAPH